MANEDVLSFTDQFGITGSYNNGVLSLTGSATPTQYETVIRSVVYSNLSEDPTPGARTVEIVVNDGDIDSDPVFRNVEVNPVNDAPVLTSIERQSASYT